jgi:hypothetical protein
MWRNYYILHQVQTASYVGGHVGKKKLPIGSIVDGGKSGTRDKFSSLQQSAGFLCTPSIVLTATPPALSCPAMFPSSVLPREVSVAYPYPKRR